MPIDNFNRPNAPNLGGNWTIVPGNEALQIVSNAVQPTSAVSGLNALEVYTAIPWTDDQISRVTLVTMAVPGGANEDDAGAVVRGATGANTFYACFVDRLASGDTLFIQRSVAGVVTTLASVAITYTNGKIMEGKVAGTALTATFDGTQQVTANDGNIASGNAGLLAFTNDAVASIVMDDFTGLLAVSVQRAVPFEALLGRSRALGVPEESLRGLLPTRGAPQESLGGRAASGGVPEESLGGLAAARSVPQESLRGLVSALTVPEESLRGLAGTAGVPFEWLAVVLAGRPVPQESLTAAGTVTAQRLVPWEALAGLVSGRPAGEESLAGLGIGRSVPEESGVVVTSVTAQRTVVWEALQGVLRSLGLPQEWTFGAPVALVVYPVFTQLGTTAELTLGTLQVTQAGLGSTQTVVLIRKV